MIKLKETRQAKGLTQSELAQAVRYADPTADQVLISCLERGDLYPGEKLRDAICKALDCTEADIYDGIEAYFVPAEETHWSDTTAMLAEIFDMFPEDIISRRRLRQEISRREGHEIADRTMRKWIAQAQREGLTIGNDQNGFGYFMPRTLEEYERIDRQIYNRAMSLLVKRKKIREKINELRNNDS